MTHNNLLFKRYQFISGGSLTPRHIVQLVDEHLLDADVGGLGVLPEPGHWVVSLAARGVEALGADQPAVLLALQRVHVDQFVEAEIVIQRLNNYGLEIRL